MCMCVYCVSVYVCKNVYNPEILTLVVLVTMRTKTLNLNIVMEKMCTEFQCLAAIQQLFLKYFLLSAIKV